MWQLFQKMPIRQKLFLVNMSVVLTALTVACGSFMFLHLSGFKQKMVEEVMTQTQMVAYYLAMPLASRHREDAEKILSSLSNRPDIESAVLFDNNRLVFAKYRNSAWHETSNGSAHALLSPYVVGDHLIWPENVSDAVIMGESYLHVMQPIMLSEEPIGFVYVRISLKEYYQYRFEVLGIFFGVALCAFLLSSLFVLRLSTLMLSPLKALREAVQQVIAGRPYSTRVEKTTEDEFGVLIDNFNQMLMGIDHRANSLLEQRCRLECDLDSRSQALNKAQMELNAASEALRTVNKTLRLTEEKKCLAENNVKTKATFLAKMSHELRTPMNGVLGMLNMLSESQLTQEQSYYARVALDSATALLAILDDILDLTKIEEGKLVIENIEFDLFAVLDEVFSVLGESAYKKNVELVWYCSGDVPAFVLGDPVRVKQVVYNVIGNAIKFTESGYISLVLSSVEAEGDPDKTVLSFVATDTGVGIRKEAQKNIFDTFTQADNSTARQFGGTGLGLALCKELTQWMGGGISVKSEWGKGSVFSFSVTVGRSKQHMMTPALVRKPDRVLILDDQSVSLMVIGQHLERLSIDYDATTSHTLFLEKLNDRHSDYDVLVIDIGLRGTTFEALLEQVRRLPQYAKTPVIAMGSLAQRAEALMNWGIRADGYWIKPIRFSDVATEIQKFGRTLSASESGQPSNVIDNVGQSAVLPALGLDKSYRLLVVEDNKVNQQVAVSRLKRFGFEVDTADNGAIALEKLHDKHFDLVFMDCHMPVLDGYETTKKIRESDSTLAKLPIIAMTANAMSGDRELCLGAGMDDYLSKPVKNIELERILSQWLQ